MPIHPLRVSGVVPAVLGCMFSIAGFAVTGTVEKVVQNPATTATPIALSAERHGIGTGPALKVADLFEILERKTVWNVEELAEVLTVSPKTLYKQAKRGNFPSFRIGSCVRVYGKGLADHLRRRMKK